MIGGTALGAMAIAYVDRKMSTAIEKHPFINEGLMLANLAEFPIDYFKYVALDELNNVAHATLSIHGQKVYMTAQRKVAVVQKAQEGEMFEDDDLEAEGSGIAFYWENPWEIKALAIKGCKSVFRKFKSFIAAVTPEEVDMKTAKPVPVEWELTSVVVDNTVVLGDRLMHPKMSSEFFQDSNGMKSDTSKKRALYALSSMFALAVFLGLRRGIRNYRMWPSYSFARQYIQNNSSVKRFYEMKEIDIVSRTGLFGPTKIDSEITITGKDSAMESVVKFTASRSDKKSPWIISQASLTPIGCKPIDLLLA